MKSRMPKISFKSHPFLLKLQIVIFLLFFLLINCEAQTNKKKLSSKHKHDVELADKYFDNYEYYLAAQEYEKSVSSDENNQYALFKLGESYRMFFNYDKAEEFYKKLTFITSNEYPQSNFWYAMMLKTNGKYDNAKTEFQKFINSEKTNTIEKSEREALTSKAKLEMEGCELALSEMKKPQRNYLFENLPGPVNTPDSEYSPTIFNNDSSIVLASARKESTGDKEYGGLGGNFSDAYRFLKTESWITNPIDDHFKNINTKFNESAGSFNKDFSKFYFSRCDEAVKTKVGTEYQCAIYQIKLKDKKWSNPVKLNENINMKGEWNAQPSISPNADTMFFVSKRPNGMGMHDIWMSNCKEEDKWEPPVNLGEKINTPYIDMSPNFYAKEKTLFFASNGIKGFGGLDIFKAQGDSFARVTTAGLPFNSNRDDFYFVLGEKKGFLASNRVGGKGNDDIYTFNIIGLDAIVALIDKDSMQKVKSITVEGKLLDNNNKKPAEDVEVLLKDSQDKTLKRTVTDEGGHFRYDNLPADQTYVITLNDHNRSLTAEVQYVSDSLSIKGSNKDATRVLFEDIFFDFNKFELRPEAIKSLNDLVTYYKKYPEIQIELDATTDNIGTDEYNLKLSNSRGQEALNFLVAKGVKKSALVVKAFGKEKPLVPNKNHIARQLNRRVEFFILGGPGYTANTMAYVIEPRMDVYQVAKKFNMSVKDLKEMNDLKNDELLAYKPLRVRRTGDNDIIAPITVTQLNDDDIKEQGSSNRQSVLQHAHELQLGQEYYIVEPNNTLFSIAKITQMTPEDIMTLNNLKNPNIIVGQRLKIKPLDGKLDNLLITKYVVKEGDTMFSIAKKFGLTLEEIKSLNNLQNFTIYENMVLKVKK